MYKHEEKICARCHASFECKVGNIGQCQCNGIDLAEEERKYIAETYQDCLCRTCLLSIRHEVRNRPLLDTLDRLHILSKTR